MCVLLVLLSLSFAQDDVKNPEDIKSLLESATSDPEDIEPTTATITDRSALHRHNYEKPESPLLLVFFSGVGVGFFLAFLIFWIMQRRDSKHKH